MDYKLFSKMSFSAKRANAKKHGFTHVFHRIFAVKVPITPYEW
jgi:hypothetical protein